MKKTVRLVFALLLSILLSSLAWHPVQAQESQGAHIAYTYANQPTTSSYTPNPSYSLNPAGSVTIDRSGTGTYAVHFSNLNTIVRRRTALFGTIGEAGGNGNVQVSTYDTPGAHCKTTSWNAGSAASTLTVNVRCFNAAGNPVDARYTLLFLEPHVNAGEVGFVWADQETNPSYIPSDTYAYNGAGGEVRITRTLAGFYTVRFENMARYANAAIPTGGGQVHVTGYGTDATKCQVSGWNTSGNDFQAFVFCRAPSGDLTDAKFTLMTLWPGTEVGTHAYAWAGQPSASSTYTPTSAYNGGRPVSVTPLGTGHYRVQFDGLTNIFGGHVQVTARQDPNTTCQIENWAPSSGNLRVTVRCYNTAGTPTNAQFLASTFFGAAPVPGNTDVAVDFSAFADGALVVNDLLSTQGIRFPNGLTIVECASDDAVCSRSRSVRKVAVPTDAGSIEFRRHAIDIQFTEGQQEVIASLNGALLDGLTRNVAMEARNSSGSVVASVTGTVHGDPGWTTRLRVASSAIARVIITAKKPTDSLDDNQIILDDLYFNDSTPPAPDTQRPSVFIDDVLDGEVITESPLRFRVAAYDNQALGQVSVEVVRVADGTFVQPPTVLCGTPASGVCPASRFIRAVVVPLSAAGDYRITATAVDAAGNDRTTSETITFDPPPPPPPAFVYKVEFNQSVTNRLYDRTISLSEGVFIIPGKELLVRYYMHSEGAPRNDYSATMHVEIQKSDGSSLNRTLSPNAGMPDVDLVPLPADTGTARRDELVTMRANADRTLNFVIPGDWFDDATFAEIELWNGTINLSRAQIRDIGDRRSILALQMVYVNELGRLPGFGRATFNTNVRPYLEKALPFSEVQILSERRFDYNGFVELRFGSPCSQLLYSLSLYGDDFGPTGLPTDGRVWMSKVIMASGSSLFGDSCVGSGYLNNPNTMARPIGGSVAHEIGHNTGREHASNAHGESGGGGWMPWPYFHGALGAPDGTFGVILDAVTPPGSSDAGQWDITLIDPCPTSNLSERFASGGCDVMNTDHSAVPHELMSYGVTSSLDSTSVPTTRGRWPSYETYTHMYNRATPRTASRTTMPALASINTSLMKTIRQGAADEPVQMLIVTGLIQPDGSADILPIMRRSARPSELADQQPGTFLVELLNAQGQTLAQASVTPLEIVDSGFGRLFVQAKLPFVEGIAGVRISDQGVLVVQQKASPNKPVVNVLTPTDGDHFEHGPMIIRWKGSDTDGDDLHYLVEYTPDNGDHWHTITVVPPDQPTEIEIDTKTLPQGIRARIRVTASDGINTSQDLSEGFFSVGPELPAGVPFDNYDIYAYNPKTGTTDRVTFLDDTGEFNPDFSKNGKEIVHDVVTFDASGAVSGQDLYITEVASGMSKPLPGGEGGNDAAYSSNGQEIAFDRCPGGSVAPLCDPTVYIVSARGGTPKAVAKDAIDPTWSNNGKYLAYHRPSDGTIITLDLRTGMETVVEKGAEPAWSPNGKHIAFTLNGNLFRTEVDNRGRPRGTSRITKGPAFDGRPAWTHNSTQVVFHSDRTGEFDLWRAVAEGDPPSHLTGLPSFGDFDPSVSNGSQQIAYAGYTDPAASNNDVEERGKAPAVMEESSDALVASNYPNPFNPTTTISFSLPESADVTLAVYDLLGRRVATLVQGSFDAGSHTVRFDAGHLPSGTYFYRVQAGSQSLVKRLTLLK